MESKGHIIFILGFFTTMSSEKTADLGTKEKRKKIYLLMKLIHPSRGHNIWVKLVPQLLEK